MAKWKSREAQLQGLPEHRSPDGAIAGNIEGRQYFRGKAFDSLDLFLHDQMCNGVSGRNKIAVHNAYSLRLDWKCVNSCR